MGQTVADAIVDRLIKWGVRRIFGYPGDGINGLLAALHDREKDIRFVQAAHEELAAFMACAHAKFTGEVGVCIATSGPGAIHLLNGLYDARLDHAPVVAILGQSPTSAIGANYQQEVDLVGLFKDVARDYIAMLAHPSAWRHQIDNAMRIATAASTVTCVVVPADLQDAPSQEPARKHGWTLTGVGYERPRIIPTEAALDRAAAVINAGERVAMLVGAGARGAPDEVLAIAEALGAGIAKALLGKAVVPDDHPLVTGAIGLLGTEASDRMMRSCDTLLMVGTGFPYTEFLPKEGQARCVQIDIAPAQLNLRFPAEVALHGDAAQTLQALLPRIRRRDGAGPWTTGIKDSIGKWWSLLESRAMSPANPINPQRVFWECSKRLPDRCILTADSGTSACWFARDLVLRRGMMASLSGGLATMCPAVPYATAAKMAFPDRVPIAFVGDGAMQMLGTNGLITIANLWREWADPRLIIAVINNRDLSMVTWELRILGGHPKFPASQDIADYDYAAHAERLGLMGLRITTPEAVGPAWDAALRAGRPCVLDFVTDPDVPMLPPHITVEQAKSFWASMFKGDPERRGVLTQSLREIAQTFAPRSAGEGHSAMPVNRG